MHRRHRAPGYTTNQNLHLRCILKRRLSAPFILIHPYIHKYICADIFVYTHLYIYTYTGKYTGIGATGHQYK